MGSNNIKNEFKDFISTLSVEICKDILLKELKNINSSFNETSKTYESLSLNYNSNLNNMKNELYKLQGTNIKLNEFVKSVDSNNLKVESALKIIEGNHKKVIDNIILDNKKLFDEYKEKIKILTANERDEFIYEFISNLDKESKKNVLELKNIVNGSKVQNVLNTVKNNSTQISDLNYQIKDVKRDIKNSEKNVIQIINNKVLKLSTQTNNTLEQLNKNLNINSNYLNTKIENLSKELKNKHNIIIMLNSVIIISFILLLLKDIFK